MLQFEKVFDKLCLRFIFRLKRKIQIIFGTRTIVFVLDSIISVKDCNCRIDNMVIQVIRLVKSKKSKKNYKIKWNFQVFLTN